MVEQMFYGNGGGRIPAKQNSLHTRVIEFYFSKISVRINSLQMKLKTFIYLLYLSNW